MDIFKLFFKSRSGNMVEVLIAIIIMGSLSYCFWLKWQVNMDTAGMKLKNKIESEQWLK